MSTTLRGAAARTFGKSVRVTELQRMSPRVLRVRLEGSAVEGIDFQPGMKIKLHVGGGQMRSYTPAALDSAAGTMDVVVHCHGDSAASRWVSAVRPGDDASFMGPGASVAAPPDGLPWAGFFGDETTIGLAEALTRAIPASTPVLGAIEVQADDMAAVTGLRLDAVQRGERHGDALVAHLADLELPSGDGKIWLSGEASAVLALRQALLERGVGREQLCIKPYWSVRGKAHRKELERTVLRSA